MYIIWSTNAVHCTQLVVVCNRCSDINGLPCVVCVAIPPWILTSTVCKVIPFSICTFYIGWLQGDLWPLNLSASFWWLCQSSEWVSNSSAYCSCEQVLIPYKDMVAESSPSSPRKIQLDIMKIEEHFNHIGHLNISKPTFYLKWLTVTWVSVKTGSPDRKWTRMEMRRWWASSWEVADIAREWLGLKQSKSRWWLEEWWWSCKWQPIYRNDLALDVGFQRRAAERRGWEYLIQYTN